jgi:glycosyltransferase involved in cell wall biosynthesis
MNIGIDIRCLMDKQLTGVGEYTLNILTHLFAMDKTNQYYLFYNSYKKQLPPTFIGENIHYCGFNFPNKLFNLSLAIFGAPKLDRIIKKKFNVQLDFFFFPNINFIKTDCPYIITAHDLTFEFLADCFSPKSRAWHKLLRPEKLFANAEQIIAVSNNTKRDVMNIYNLPEQQITTIYSGVAATFIPNLQETPTAKRIKNKYQLPTKFIFFLGALEPRKNILTLIEAFEIFKKNSAPAKQYSLVIAGKHGWRANELETMIQHSPAKDFIKIIDYIAPEDKPYLYNLADLFVYPSLYEGFGFPVLEAMACGCPVITSHTSSLPEICATAAAYIDPNNVNDLDRQIQFLTTNTAERKRLITAGFARTQNFSWKNTSAELLKIFNKQK